MGRGGPPARSGVATRTRGLLPGEYRRAFFADLRPETLSVCFVSPLSDIGGCCTARPVTVFFPIPCRQCAHHGVMYCCCAACSYAMQHAS